MPEKYKNNHTKISSFWNIYKHLSPEEKREFYDFVCMPQFNEKQSLLPIAKYLKDVPDDAWVDKNEVLKKAVGKKTVNHQVLKNQLTVLKKLLLEYLQVKWLQEKTSVRQLATAEIYAQRGITDLQENFHQKKITGPAHAFLSPDELYYNMKMKTLADEYFSTSAVKRRFDLLEDCMADLRNYYLLETMRMYCELVNRKNLKAVEFNETRLQNFLQYFLAHAKPEEMHPLLQIYYRVFCFLYEPQNETAYQQYKKLLQKYVSEIPQKTARELCLFGQNQCVKHINLNHHGYLAELFELYNLMLKENIMYEGKYMTQWTFKNYITVALRLKEFTKAEKFIENYVSKIPPSVRDDSYHYNIAAVHFEKNDYDKAMEELLKIHFNDAIYYLDSRSMLLKIYFDRDDFEALGSLYHSVRVYLLRIKQLSKKQADLYRNLFAYTYKLSRLLYKKPFIPAEMYDKELHKLIQKTGNTDIANKTWLLSKMQGA